MPVNNSVCYSWRRSALGNVPKLAPISLIPQTSVAASVARSSKAPQLQAAFLLFIGETPISGFRVGTSGRSSSLSGQFIFQSTAEYCRESLSTSRTSHVQDWPQQTNIYFNTYKRTS